MTKFYSSLLVGAMLSLTSLGASAEKLDDGKYSLPGTYTFTVYKYGDNAKYEDIDVTISYDASRFKYVIKEKGTNVLPYDVFFNFDETSNTIKFPQSNVTGSTSIWFSAYVYDDYWYQTNVIDNYAVPFNPETGAIEFPAEYFGFAWVDDVNQLDSPYPDFITQIEVSKALQKEDSGDDNGDDDNGDDNPGGGDVEEPVDGDWKNIGNATLMDGWILPLLGINQYENMYEVPVQQNIENPNLYRLVNPYKDGPAALYNAHATKEGFIEFDVTDPEKVKFSYVYAGFSNQTPDGWMFDDIYCIDMWSWMSKKYESNAAQLNSFWKIYGYANSTYDAETREIYMGSNGKSGYDLNYAACVGTPDQIRQEGDVPGGTNWQDADDGHFLDMTTKIILPEVVEEPTTGDITGNMTAQSDQTQGFGDEPELNEPEEYEVTASYNTDTRELTIFNFAGCNPLTLNVDVENNTASATQQIVATPDDDFPTYFGDFTSKTYGVNANIYARGENQTVLYVEPWGEVYDIDTYDFFPNVLYYNTVVTLDTTIEGLAQEPTEEPETPEVITGNMTAQLDMNNGATVDRDLLDPEEWEITATYDEATQTLTLNNVAECEPLSLYVNYDNYTATTFEQIVSTPDDDFPMYFGDINCQTYGFVADMYARGDDQTVLYVDPWGEIYDITYFGFYAARALFNTVIVLDKAIEGLIPEPVVKVVSFNCSELSEDGNVDCVVEVEAEGLYHTNEVVLYFKGDNDETFSVAERLEPEVAGASEKIASTHVFTLSELEENCVYNATVYAQAGKIKSEESAFQFTAIPTGVDGITVDGDNSVRYFNLQGIEISKPAAGTVVIRVSGDKTVKELVK